MPVKSVPVEVTLPPINQPVFDRSTGLVTDPWYRYFESARNRSGGDIDQVDGSKVAASVADDKAVTADEKAVDAQTDLDGVKLNEITAGIGLEGGGQIGGDITIDALQRTGWIMSTGTADSTTPYATPASFTVSNPPTQAEVQAIANALIALAKRYVALERAIRDNEGIAL